MDKLKEEVIALREVKGRVARLFNPNTSEADRQESLQHLMVAGGISEADARAMLSGSPEPEPEPEPEKAGSTVEPKNQTAAQLKILQDEVAALKADQAGRKKADTQSRLSEAVSDSVGANAKAQAFLSRVESLGGQDQRKKVDDFLRRDIIRGTMERLYSRKQQVGTFDPAWISEEARKATEESIEKAQAYAVASPQTGRGGSAGDETSLFADLLGKKLDPPKFDSAKSKGELSTNVTDWSIKRLSQAAATAERDSGGKSKV